MHNIDVILVVGILIFFGLTEAVSGYLKNSKRSKADWVQELVSFFALSTMIKPLIVSTVYVVGQSVSPSSRTLLVEWDFWLLLLPYLIVDDGLQYWYHRAAHENPFLWKLHRTHHQAEEMGFFVSYRNAALYYLMMPNIWWMGLITFLGGGKVVSVGLVLKQLIIISSHSRVTWDQVFYKYTFLTPFVRIMERIIVTPAFHHSHHGRSKLDAASDPNGNFGNMFSIWDQLFGTATFTRSYPKSYGLQRPTQDAWASYLYPLIKSKDTLSEVSDGFSKPETKIAEPTTVKLEKGTKYLWCRCGLSQNQPFCDGSHHGTKNKPLLFEAKRDASVKLCNCKLSKRGPYCDDSHLNL